jgi:hypothetical protein
MPEGLVNEKMITGPLQSSVVTVTPEIAARWLERNHKENRPISWKRVQAFANDMTTGNWKLTHQAVAFDGAGNLTDGQHRLQAVVTSGKSVQMFVVRNEKGDFHDPIDRGQPRSIALLMGQNARVVGALVVLRMLESGYYVATPMTLAEANEIYEHHKTAIEALNERVPGFYKMTSGVAAACIYSFAINESAVSQWASQVLSGEMIKRGDPAFAFRRWREQNPRIAGWTQAMAALACIRYAINSQSIASVFTGDTSYRAVTSKRRSMRLPFTPGVDLVKPGIAWSPERDREHG